MAGMRTKETASKPCVPRDHRQDLLGDPALLRYSMLRLLVVAMLEGTMLEVELVSRTTKTRSEEQSTGCE